MSETAELALSALARDLVEEIAAGRALELAAAPPDTRAIPAIQEIPEPKTGAAAVHPHLGGRLVTLPGDTLSGHAHAHVPRPWPVSQPTPQDTALGEAHAALDIHRRAELDRMSAEQAAVRAQRTGQPEPGTYVPLDDDAYAAHVARAGKLTGEALKAGHATSSSQALDGRGQVWSPERAAQHNEIVAAMLARAQSIPSEHKAMLITGPDRDARKAAAKQAPDFSRHAVVSADEIKAELARREMVPGTEGLSPAERSPLVHAEAGHIANLAAARLMAAGKNLALDMPGADQAAVRGHLGRLKKAGYTVHGVLADVPPEHAHARAGAVHRKSLENYRQGTGDGSRPGSPGQGHRETFDAVRGQLSSWQRFDGSRRKPELAEQSGQPEPAGVTSVEDLMRARP